MARRLILTGFLLCGLLYVGVAEARVCALGDEGCEHYGEEGPDNGKCSSDYKKCDDPRAGATYCGQKGTDGKVEALYRAEDCCSMLAYKECPEADHEMGYGKSCQGAKSHTKYWEFCGCSFGFVDTEPDAGGSVVNSTDGLIVDDDNHEIPYLSRCDTADDPGKCKLAVCNTARRWFYQKGGEHCLYRSTTKCGGIVCSQLYDCDNDNDFYRAEDLELTYKNGRKYDNYIDFSTVDPWSNEKDDVKGRYLTWVDDEYKVYKPAHIELPYGRKIVGDNSPNVAGTDSVINYTDIGQGTIVYGDYRVTNRLVCGYLRNNGSGDTSGGLDCNDIKNYCYKWTGCNTARGWHSTAPNIGILYGERGQVVEDYTTEGIGAYEHWMNEVERSSIYKSIYNAMSNISPATALGEGFDLDPQKNQLRQNFYNMVKPQDSTAEVCPNDEVCTKYSKGCTYITHACHKGSYECFKRIGCTEENRFYHSFINAAIESYDDNGQLLEEVNDKNGARTNILYNSSLNGIYWMDFYKAETADGLSGIDPREVYPACVYEINACNDTINNGRYGGGCYRKQGCTANFEDIWDHLTIEEDWLNWFKDWRPICNDNTRCYQASACDLPGGSYSSEPNTSFFFTIKSVATGSECYRGANCHFDVGSYSSIPNTLFFQVIESSATGSICYRGQNCRFGEGAYSSEPNTSFFFTSDSITTGSQCYRGEGCRGDAGVYESKPNELFFKVIESQATGETCYRGEDCMYDDGAYSSEPNTSFFFTISSEASSSICYRGEDCFYDVGAYISEPNTLFFKTIESQATGKTCYRGEDCMYEVGAYSTTPNAEFFKVIESLASGSTCYRAQCCTPPNCELEKPDTSFFYAIYSEASDFHGDVACYRAPGCHQEAGAYSSEPNASFFEVAHRLFGEACRNDRGVCPGFDPAETSICYRGTACNLVIGAYSSTPNTSFFITADSLASGSQCYRGVECHLAAGAYSSTPNTSFFYDPVKSYASGSECYRKNDRTTGGVACNTDAGSYPIEQGEITLNTSYFYTIESKASGTSCYRASRCHTEIGAYEDSPNTSFFFSVTSLQSWASICYRAHECHNEAGAREGVPCTASDEKSECFKKNGGFCNSDTGCFRAKNYEINPRFFKVVYSLASGSTCYRGDRCNTAGGAYRTKPNTKFFVTINSVSLAPDGKTGTTCYRGQECNLAVGAYTSAPNLNFFTTISSLASGSECYRVKDCIEPNKANDGPCRTYPDTAYFNVEYSSIAGYTCAIATGCKAYNFTSGTSGGELFVWNWETWDSTTCPYIVKPAQGFDDVNYCIFNRAAAPGPDDHTTFASGSSPAGYGEWKFTKGKSTAKDENREPQCTQKYDNTGTISVDECGQEMNESGTSVTAYYPLGCNERNGWEANKADKFNSCYFKATSITKHFIVNINQNGNNPSEFTRLEDFKAGEKDLTCYKYTEPRVTQNDFESCIYKFQRVLSTEEQTDGAPSAVGGTSNEMPQTCSDSTKGAALTGYELTCGDNNNALEAYYPNGCDDANGWFETVSSENITTNTHINDRVNEKFFAKRYITTSNTFNSKTCYDQSCYKATRPLCTAPINVFNVVAIRATGGESSCSADTLEATYATGCNKENGFYARVGYDEDKDEFIDEAKTILNAAHFTIGTSKITSGENCGKGDFTCYRAIGCKYEPHPNWCVLRRVEQDGVPCEVDDRCKEPADPQYFTTISADCRTETPITCTSVATGVKCERGNDYVFTWGSTSTTNSVQRYEDKVYKAVFPTGCKTSNGFYPTSLTSTCSTSYFTFEDVQTAEGCGHEQSCQRYKECAQNPDTCYVVPTTVSCGNTSTNIATCAIAASCKDEPNTSYFKVDNVPVSDLGTSCSSASGVRESCTRTDTEIFSWSPIESIDCSSRYATRGAYTAYQVVGCNSNNSYYPSQVVRELGEHYDFDTPGINKVNCVPLDNGSTDMTCHKFNGCKEKDEPNLCFVEIDYSVSFYEQANSKTYYCKYKCKDFEYTWAEKYFTSGYRTSRGIPCKVATGAKCTINDKLSTPNRDFYNWSSETVDCNSGIATDGGSYTSHYITGCKNYYSSSSSDIFEFENISTVSSDCNPDGITCSKVIGCNTNAGWTLGDCGTGYYRTTSTRDSATGITCSKCIPEWYIERPVVILTNDPVIETSSDNTKKEKARIVSASYNVVILNHNGGMPSSGNANIINEGGSSTSLELLLGVSYNSGTPSTWEGNTCTSGGSCTVAGEPRTVCGPYTITEEDILNDKHKCKIEENCIAQIMSDNVYITVTPPSGVTTYPYLLRKNDYIECKVRTNPYTCAELGLYKSSDRPDGWECETVSVTASDSPCYSCYEPEPEPQCSDFGYWYVPVDEYPDTSFFNCDLQALPNGQKCAYCTGCASNASSSTPLCTGVKTVGDKLYDGTWCYIAAGCEDSYVNADANSCAKGVKDICEYGGYKCGLCKNGCTSLGDGWEEGESSGPTDRQKFFFNYKSSTVDGTYCYKATGCNHGAVQNTTEDDGCSEQMSGMRCNIIAPNALQINKNSYTWKLGSDSLNSSWFTTRGMTVNKMTSFKKGTRETVEFYAATAGCSKYPTTEDYKLAISNGSLQDWTTKGKTCPIDTNAAMFDGEQELWGDRWVDDIKNKFRYNTQFLVKDGSTLICAINKDVCLNGCGCVPSCEDIGLKNDEPSGQVCEEVPYKACNPEVTITCYTNCKDAYFPRKTILDTTFLKSNFVCDANKIAYPISKQEAYYQSESGSKTAFDLLTYSIGDGLKNVSTGEPHGAYDMFSWKSGDVIKCYINSVKVGQYTLNTASGSYSAAYKSTTQSKSNGSALCMGIEEDNIVASKLKFSLPGGDYQFETYPLETVKDLTYNGVTKNYVSNSITLNNAEITNYTYVVGYPMTFIGTSSTTTKDGDKTYTFNKGDECQFWGDYDNQNNGNKTKKVKDGEVIDQGRNQGSHEILTGQFLFANDVPSNINDFYDYTYLEPCYTGLDCSDKANPFYKLKNGIKNSCNTDANQSKFKELKKFFNFDKLNVLDQPTADGCERLNGCNVAEGCLTEAEMIAKGFDMNNFEWSVYYQVPDDVIAEWNISGCNADVGTALDRIAHIDPCFCPLDGCHAKGYDAQIYNSNGIDYFNDERSDVREFCQIDDSDKGYVETGVYVGDFHCVNCIKCSDDGFHAKPHNYLCPTDEGYSAADEANYYDYCKTEIKNAEVRSGAREITCYKDCQKCSDNTRLEEHIDFKYTNACYLQSYENTGYTCTPGLVLQGSGAVKYDEICNTCWKITVEYINFCATISVDNAGCVGNGGNSYQTCPLKIGFQTKGAKVGSNTSYMAATITEPWLISVNLGKWENKITVNATCPQKANNEDIIYGGGEHLCANNASYIISGLQIDECEVNEQYTQQDIKVKPYGIDVEVPGKFVGCCNKPSSCRAYGAYDMNDAVDREALDNIKNDNGCEEAPSGYCECGNDTGINNCRKCPVCTDYSVHAEQQYYSESKAQEQAAAPNNKGISKVDPAHVGNLTKCYGICSDYNKGNKEYYSKDQCEQVVAQKGAGECELVPASEEIAWLTECYTYKDPSLKVTGLVVTMENKLETWEKCYDWASVTGIKYEVKLSDGRVVKPDSINGSSADTTTFALQTIGKALIGGSATVNYKNNCNKYGSCIPLVGIYGNLPDDYGTNDPDGGRDEDAVRLATCTASIEDNPVTIGVDGAASKTFAADEFVECKVVVDTSDYDSTKKCSDYNTETQTYYARIEQPDGYECELAPANEVCGLICFTCDKCSNHNTEYKTYYSETEKDAKESEGYTCKPVSIQEVGELTCYTCEPKSDVEIANIKVYLESTTQKYNTYYEKAVIKSMGYKVLLSNGTETTVSNISPNPFKIRTQSIVSGDNGRTRTVNLDSNNCNTTVNSDSNNTCDIGEYMYCHTDPTITDRFQTQCPLLDSCQAFIKDNPVTISLDFETMDGGKSGSITRTFAKGEEVLCTPRLDLPQCSDYSSASFTYYTEAEKKAKEMEGYECNSKLLAGGELECWVCLTPPGPSAFKCTDLPNETLSKYYEDADVSLVDDNITCTPKTHADNTAIPEGKTCYLCWNNPGPLPPTPTGQILNKRVFISGVYECNHDGRTEKCANAPKILVNVTDLNGFAIDTGVKITSTSSNSTINTIFNVSIKTDDTYAYRPANCTTTLNEYSNVVADLFDCKWAEIEYPVCGCNNDGIGGCTLGTDSACQLESCTAILDSTLVFETRTGEKYTINPGSFPCTVPNEENNGGGGSGSEAFEQEQH